MKKKILCTMMSMVMVASLFAMFTHHAKTAYDDFGGSEKAAERSGFPGNG